jgi:hypothetical protein
MAGDDTTQDGACPNLAGNSSSSKRTKNGHPKGARDLARTDEIGSPMPARSGQRSADPKALVTDPTNRPVKSLFG